jgi:hypothetical protein
MKPLARWTIGPVKPDGFDCLWRSIESFTALYDVDVAICFNCERENLAEAYARFDLIDQRNYLNSCPVPPMGVAWKLYPPRLDPSRHEILIDNDIVFEKRVPQIDEFFESDCTLLLEDHARAYGRFEKHVPPGLQINSGIYGMPPGFDFDRFIKFYAGAGWERNALFENAESKTFDEQGLVAIGLLSYRRYVIIPATTVTNCEHYLINGHGHHFVGLNRRAFHRPYRLWKNSQLKIYL